MIVNPDKHHAMVLGTTDHKLSFPVVDSQNLLGMTIDNQLNFSEHVSLVCRFRNLICIATKLKFYNAFILPHFQYCSMVWHFCSARNCNNLLISAPYVLLSMIKFRPTSSYYIIQEEQLFTTKGFKIC